MSKILIDEAVLRQALEALLCAPLDRSSIESRFFERRHHAIITLRQALADAVLDKMADNARELGLTYDASVVCIDTSPERVEKEAGNKHMPTPPECKTEAEKTAFAFGWFKALESVREQPTPAQDPVCRLKEDGSCGCRRADLTYACCKYTTPPAPAQPLNDEVLLHKICDAMKPLADHSINWNGWPGTYKFAQAALSAIKNHVQAPPAPAQENEFKPDWNNYRQGFKDGAAEEREACAKLCDELHSEGEDNTGLAADMIRARDITKGGAA